MIYTKVKPKKCIDCNFTRDFSNGRGYICIITDNPKSDSDVFEKNLGFCPLCEDKSLEIDKFYTDREINSCEKCYLSYNKWFGSSCKCSLLDTIITFKNKKYAHCELKNYRNQDNNNDKNK